MTSEPADSGPAGASAKVGAGISAIYLMLSLLFFLPALLPGKQIFGTDYLSTAYFWEEFASARFAAGEIPSWLPTVYGGVPFFANPMDVYYPASVLFRLVGLPTHLHLALLFVVQYWIAGTGTYLLLRELGARTAPSALGGLAYMFTGYLISYVYAGHDGRAIVATLAPLFLFALHGGMRTGLLRWFALAGAVLGSAFLSFQIQSSYYLMLAGGLWCLYLLWALRGHRPARQLLRRLAGGAATLVLAFALAAVNFVPFAGYVESSPRAGSGGRGYDYAVSWSMPPEEIAGLAVPERSGTLEYYRGVNPFKLHTEYAGALVLLLCFMGGYVLKGVRGPWFFVALGAFALTLAFGGYTPLYRLYYAFLPGTAKFRAPSIAFFLVSLSLVVFAASALDRLMELRDRVLAASPEDPPSEADEELVRSAAILAVMGAVGVLAWAGWATFRAATSGPGPSTAGAGYALGMWRFSLFAVLTAAVLVLWLRGWVRTLVAVVVLALVTLADLWLVDRQFFHTVREPSEYFAPDEVAGYLRQQEGPFRVYVLSDLPQNNYFTLFGIQLVGGDHGNQLSAYNEFLGEGETSYTDFGNLEDPRYLALVNARYLVTTLDLDRDYLEPVFRGRTSGTQATVYENRRLLPRAFMVPTATSVLGWAGLQARMRQGSFAPDREVLLYGESRATELSDPGAAGDAEILQYDPARVVVRTRSPKGGHLVLTDNFYPGWQAAIDGEEASIQRAYHTFRAVAVPAGDHEVVFTFEPAPLRAGLVISFTTALLLLSGGVVWLLGRRLRPAPAGTLEATPDRSRQTSAP